MRAPRSRPVPAQIVQAVLIGILVIGAGTSGAGCGVGGANEQARDDDAPPDTTAPAAPTTLTADAGNAQVTLTWTTVDDAATYAVYRTTTVTDSVPDRALATEIEPARYVDETPANGTTYYYRVTAVDSAGNESSGSDATQSTPFASPSRLTTDADSARVHLNWTKAPGATTYTVYRTTAPTDSASGPVLDAGVSTSAYTDTAATTGTTYYYRVTAVNPEDEESPASQEKQGTPFVPPTNLRGTSGDSQVELDWTAAPGAKTYNVYRSTNAPPDTSAPPLTRGVSRPPYTDTTAQNRTTYYYRVTTTNPEGEESRASNEVKKTPFSEPPDRPS